MKMFVSMLTIAAAIAFTGPAFAGETPADCVAGGGTWNGETNTCE